MDNVNVYAVEADEQNGVKQLQVPLWFGIARNGVHLRRQAVSQAHDSSFRAVRDRQSVSARKPQLHDETFLRTIVSILSIEKSQGNPWGIFQRINPS